MSTRIAVVIAFLSLIGCTPPPPGRVAATLPCDGTGRCEVKIINPTCSTTPCSADVDFDTVKFTRGKHDIKVHWRLPAGFGFCPNTGDGVFLKKPEGDNQFKDPGVDGQDGPGVCKRPQFVMTARNTKVDTKYQYKIVFHDAAGNTEYIVDPLMFNE
jgi:hypothetical protein